jgi:hypothetical protein
LLPPQAAIDPFSALSLAVAIFQFIDYGSKIVSHTKEIAGSGSSVNVQHFSRITSDLIGINSNLSRQLKLDVKSNSVADKEVLVSFKLSFDSVPILTATGSLRIFKRCKPMQ